MTKLLAIPAGAAIAIGVLPRAQWYRCFVGWVHVDLKVPCESRSRSNVRAGLTS